MTTVLAARNSPRTVGGSARNPGDAVVALLRGHEPALPPGTVETFVAAVRRHRVAPLAHVRLQGRQPDVAAALRPDRDEALAVNVRAALLLGELGHVLDGLPWVTFKGLTLSELAHPAPGLRTFRDLDVLVHPRTLREVAHRLLAAGWLPSDYQDALRRTDPAGEMNWLSPTGLGVDLHWSMNLTTTVRRRYAVHSGELLDRRRTARLGLVTAPVLEPVDALLHVCLHAALTGAYRLLLLLDIDQLARAVTDWDAVARRARDWAAGPPVALALWRAQHVLGTPVPDRLAAMLGLGRGFRALCAVTDAVDPVQHASRERSVARLVARAARRSTVTTLLTIGGHAAQGVRDTVLPPRPPVGRQRADAASLEAYLGAVEAVAEGER